MGDPAAIVTTTVVSLHPITNQCTQLTSACQPNGPPLPTGSALALHRASDGSLDLYLADGLQAAIVSTYQANCVSDTTNCESSIQDTLLAADYDLESRAIGFILFAGGILLAAFAQ